MTVADDSSFWIFKNEMFALQIFFFLLCHIFNIVKHLQDLFRAKAVESIESSFLNMEI